MTTITDIRNEDGVLLGSLRNFVEVPDNQSHWSMILQRDSLRPLNIAEEAVAPLNFESLSFNIETYRRVVNGQGFEWRSFVAQDLSQAMQAPGFTVNPDLDHDIATGEVRRLEEHMRFDQEFEYRSDERIINRVADVLSRQIDEQIINGNARPGRNPILQPLQPLQPIEPVDARSLLAEVHIERPSPRGVLSSPSDEYLITNPDAMRGLLRCFRVTNMGQSEIAGRMSKLRASAKAGGCGIVEVLNSVMSDKSQDPDVIWEHVHGFFCGVGKISTGAEVNACYEEAVDGEPCYFVAIQDGPVLMCRANKEWAVAGETTAMEFRRGIAAGKVLREGRRAIDLED